MASISSMASTSSATSSIYGSRNVLSGLASGMDTESMIENAVSGIKMKIQTLQQKRTKIEWQQEAFRSIIDKAVNFNTKYTSYTSKTNLLSQSFFNNAVNTAINGTYKDKLTASGKSTSDIKINAVKQMATSASYTVSGLGGISSGEIMGIEAGEEFGIRSMIDVSTVSGSLSFQYGGTNGTTFDIKFDELEDWDEVEGRNNAEKLANAINQKLSEVTYNYTKNGFAESTTADKAIKATANSDGTISFTDGLGNGNKVTICSATGNIKSAFGLTGSDNQTIDTSSLNSLSRSRYTYEYLGDKNLTLSFNGTSKTISMKDVLAHDGAITSNEGFVSALNEEMAKAFGTGKIEASYADGKLTITPNGQGDILTLSGTAVETLGFESGDANYINSAKKLTDILGDKADAIFSQENRLKGSSGPIKKTSPNGTTYYVDSNGDRVDENGYRVDENNKPIYDMEINGTHINVSEDTTLESLINSINSNADAGVKVSYSKLTNEFKFTTTETGANTKIEFGGLAKALFGDTEFTPVTGEDKVADILGGFDYDTGNNFQMTVGGNEFTMHVDENDTMDDIMEKISVLLTWENGDDPNVGLTYSASIDPETNRLVIKDADGNTVDYSADTGMAKDLFDKMDGMAHTYTAGQDAIMDVEINGVRFEDLTRSSNSFDLDGLTVNVKGTFNEDGSNIDKDGNDIEPITFETTTDTEKIIDVIREFVNDYNEMATELKNAYSTMPAEKSDGSRYDPLTAEAEAEYSESELAAYNEKAKQGILFGDTTLTSMYSKLLSAITPGGADGQTLREIGIGTSYSDGMTTLSLDEDKLRTALETDPDKVKDAFTKTKEGGSSSDGLMQTLQNTLNTYVKTTGEPKGSLIVKAGSVKAITSLNSNSLQSQINSIDDQIERWQDKMSTQIDRYTTKFTRLEQLIAEMNSQASTLAGLMGGDAGY